MAIPDGDRHPVPAATRPWVALRAAWRVTRAVCYLLGVSLLMRWSFPRLAPAHQDACVRRWSRGVFDCLGIAFEVRGHLRPGAKLVVGNHVSWLDIMAINSVEACRFVSKAEVAHWPVVGRMVTLAGTIYLERARRRDAMRVFSLLAQALREGHSAAVFPEGTTGHGDHLLPFHGNLLQSAIDADVPVQAVAIRYSDAGHAISPAPVYAGDTSLVESLWQVACAERLTATLTVLPPRRVTHTDRRALAERLREDIAAALG